MNPRQTLAAILAGIVERHGLDEPLVALPGGVTNHVFSNGQQVVRFPRDPQRGVVTDMDEFVKEAWCAEVARGLGIRTPAVLAVDMLDGVPHQIQARVAGEHPDEHTPALWRRLGERAARLAASAR